MSYVAQDGYKLLIFLLAGFFFLSGPLVAEVGFVFLIILSQLPRAGVGEMHHKVNMRISMFVVYF